MEKVVIGQILHAKARRTEAKRREIRNNKESIAKAASRFNVNPKTIIKSRKREMVLSHLMMEVGRPLTSI